MTARYRVLALDLDGTTLLPDGTIAPETKHWIDKAAQAGVLVICATGRGRPNAESIWMELCPNSPAVLANGADIWLNLDTPLERRYMKAEYVFKLYELAQEVGGFYWAYSANGSIQDGDDIFQHEPGEGWFKFGIHHPDPAVITHVWNTASAWKEITVTSSHPSNVEVSAHGVSKKSGVERICQEFGWSLDEVMAVGDSHNDLELLTAAGLGVAVANATKEVQKAADKLTKSNAENGVAYAIQHFLLQN